MKTRRVCGKGICAIVAIVCVNWILTFLMVPAIEFNDELWKTYEVCGDVDTIYIGSSVCMAAFDTYLMDDLTGGKSINLGLPQQDVVQSYGTLRMVLKQKPSVKRVVFAMDYSSLQLDTDHMSAMKYGYQLMEHEQNPIDKVCVYRETMGIVNGWASKDSINFFFPWVNNHVDIFGNVIQENVQRKLRGQVSQPRTEFYERYKDYMQDRYDLSVNMANRYGKDEITDQKMQVLEDMIRECNEAGVEMMVLITPYPYYNIVSYGDSYYTIGKQIKELVEENGAYYYDYNFINPERFDILKDEHYADFEHLTVWGARDFSISFAQFLMDKDEGEDMSQAFLTREAYEERINGR